jgi:hypothetical protein
MSPGDDRRRRGKAQQHLFVRKEDEEDAMMKTSLRLAVLAAVALVSLPARADMTAKSADGSMELALPNGWHDIKPDGAATKIVAIDGKGSRVAVRVYPKDDFKDVKALADFAVNRLKLIDSDGVKTEDIQIGGKPAVRISVVGTGPNEMRAGYLITILEGESAYVEVLGRTDASSIARETPVFGAFATALKIIPAVAAAPAPAPAPTIEAKPTKPVPPKQ